MHVIRTDNGTEYTSEIFNNFCEEVSIEHQLTVPYTPQQNGVVEKKNRTLMEMTRYLLHEKGLPKKFRVEAANTVGYNKDSASFGCSMGWKIYQPDVKSAFLNGYLEEEIFVEQPEGFVVKGKEDKVYHLKKALYGLKQAPRAWNGSASELAQDIHLSAEDIVAQSIAKVKYIAAVAAANQALWIRKLLIDLNIEQTGSTQVFVDNQAAISIASNLVFHGRTKHFKIKFYFLREIQHDGEVTLVHCKTEVQNADILTKALPIARQAVKHILHYLKGTSHYGLSIQATPNYNLTCFTNVDHAPSPDDHQSTSSYFVFMGSNIISWFSTKQKVVSRSTTESKYRAVANGAAELSWIGSLLRELNIATNSIPCLYYDNISASYMTHNPVFHGRTKHIEIDFHFVREKVFHKILLCFILHLLINLLIVSPKHFQFSDFFIFETNSQFSLGL
ncbi:Retrovirus-related Pol polyprotein from transposon RE1 [Vitis vinifera]|uniref:Retrovirus-related Pol polyprotein from transposon RE1 n=1 Tax=Vitis vinifera TaxID=29760 RepID=A0A438EUT8_VITVI|nr:Retrovirus-related Pol polyprotein from transposon RE1 [Vitis vinifera]